MLGHGGSGKTSLVDALCFAAGSGKRHGAVRDGTALTDHLPEEIERGYSISLGCAYAEWMDSKINFIDTPGSLDFQGETIAGLAAADGALCVISAASGVEVGTERAFRAAMAKQDPVLFAVSMMDKEHADFDRIYQQIKQRLTAKVIPVEVPCGEGAGFRGVINLFTQRAYMYTSGTKGNTWSRIFRPNAWNASRAIGRSSSKPSAPPMMRCSNGISRGRRSIVTTPFTA